MPWDLLVLFVGAAAAGCLNILAGGGALITMPLLLWLGVPETTANGTVRLGVLVQGLSAAVRYHREGAVPWGALRWMVIPVLLGAASGAWVATLLSAESFRSILAAVTLGVGLLVVVNVKSRLSPRTGMPRAVVIVGLVVAGFYGGMIQAGVGYLFLAALTLLAGLDLVTANVLKALLVLAYTPVVIAVFWHAQAVDLSWGATLAVGQGLGGWLGASLALRRGANLIRWVLLAALTISFVSLVWR